ncbi:MAG TPA: hypothetical protein VNF47_01920 [Streptosporangiaceae bacterium]|nr:hypothetical protein [Streptosporangiaceae bacterium]
MIEQTPHCRVAVGRGFAVPGSLGRVDPEQVVQHEPTGPMLGQHLLAGELTENLACPLDAQPGQAGRRRKRKVRAGMQPEQAEQARRGIGHRPVGPAEYSTDAHRRRELAGNFERFQPTVRPAQLGHDLGRLDAWRYCRPGRGNAESQGQPGAQADQLSNRALVFERIGRA